MAMIGVVVTKSVLIDRDGARSLLRAYSDWLNRLVPDEEHVVQQNVETFLKSYADVSEGASDG